MQRRERILALAVGGLLGLWLLDGAVIEPALNWYDGVRDEADSAANEVAASQALVDRETRILADWRSRHAAGLLDDEAAARFRVQRVLAEAARSGGLTIDNVGSAQLIPASRDETCDTLRFTVSGQGSLAQGLAFIAGLEQAAQPLRIERSELASSDPRRDQIELSLTVSTRLVPALKRAKRSVPDGTEAWQPDAVDPAHGAAVVAAKPFLADRHSATVRPVTTEAPPPIAGPTGTWAMVGIVTRPSGAVAFLRHTGDGRERILAPGEEFESAQVVTIDSSGMTLRDAAGERKIAVGSDLAGTPVVFGSAPRRSGSTTSTSTPSARPTTSSGPSPFAVPAPTTDPGREAILERLRQQRNRSP